METYTFLRELADSWVLLAMFIFLGGIWVWAFWPGLAAERSDASMIPFRNENKPATACDGSCAGCKSKAHDLNMKEASDV